MFDISKSLVYDNMVQGRRVNIDEVPAPLGQSRWIDVPLTGGSHWTTSTAKAVLTLLEPLRAIVTAPELMPDIAMLSPFKDVVAGLRAVREEFLQSLNLRPFQDAEAKKHFYNSALAVGTVHTFQGRERDNIVFVLGGATQGARKWVADTPNLINVAVTRARNRIYVVGEYQAWRLGYGNTLTDKLKPLPTI